MSKFLKLCLAASPLLFTLLVLTGGGCSAKPEPVAEPSKRFRPAEEGERAAAASKEASDVRVVSQTAAAEVGRQYATGATSDADGKAPAAGETSAPAGVSGELLTTLTQLDKLGNQQPKGNNPQEQMENVMLIQSQRLALAKKAMTLNPPANVKPQIAMAMYEIYAFYVQARAPGATGQLTSFLNSLVNDPNEEVARLGRHGLFKETLQRIVSQPLENGKEIVAESKKMLEAEAGKLSAETQDVVGQAADLLTNGGFYSDAADLNEAIAAALSTHPTRAKDAAQHAVLAKMLRLDMDKLVNDVLKGEPEAEAKVAAAVKQLLAEFPADAALFSRISSIANIMESSGRVALAQECYDGLGEKFKDATDPELASAKDAAEKARTRMGLVGQPLEVEGVLVDGQPFDWSAYRGKVVLVDFWATWCRPCIEEMPNVMDAFREFHSKGFDVVGVNVNVNATELKQFLSFQNLPWVNVTSQAVLEGKLSEDQWTEIPMAKRCGVNGIPFVVLVGKDGKVDSIHVRGSKLKKRLTELLGEPLAAEVPEDPTSQPASAAAKAGGTSR